MITSNRDLQIGTISKKSGVSIDTIRYYEKEGLLPQPMRTSSGFRIYTPEIFSQLNFIRRARELGMTLKEIRQIRDCGEQGLGPCCKMTVDLFNQKIKNLESTIHSLTQIKRKIRSILKTWVNKKEMDPQWSNPFKKK
jgi:MerR family mercuric resistance operon transcriptional regulator